MKVVNLFLSFSTASLVVTGSLGLNLYIKNNADYVQEERLDTTAVKSTVNDIYKADDPPTLTGVERDRQQSSGNNYMSAISGRANKHGTGYDRVDATTGRPTTRKPKKETKKPETKKPETKKPETKKPETKKPETSKVNDGGGHPTSTTALLPESQNQLASETEPDRENYDENALNDDGKENSKSSVEPFDEADETITTDEPLLEFQATTATAEDGTTLETLDETEPYESDEEKSGQESLTDIEGNQGEPEKVDATDNVGINNVSTDGNGQDESGNLDSTSNQGGSDQRDEDGGDDRFASSSPEQPQYLNQGAAATPTEGTGAIFSKPDGKKHSHSPQNIHGKKKFGHKSRGKKGRRKFNTRNDGGGDESFGSSYSERPQYPNQGAAATETEDTGGEFSKDDGKKHSHSSTHSIHGVSSSKKKFGHKSRGKKGRRKNNTKNDGGGDQPKRISNYEKHQQQFTYDSKTNRDGD